MGSIKKKTSFFNESLDISQGKIATSSSSLDGYPACNGNDNNNENVWCASDGSMTQWWKVDLGEFYNIIGISVTLAPAEAEFQYKIEVSADDLNYYEKVDKTLENYSGEQTNNLEASSVRYVRVRFIDSNTGDWASLSNVSVYGREANSNTTVPSVTGRVVYHSYNDYGDGSSNIYILNLGNRSLNCISSSWTNISDPMNSVWSSDGKKIVFMAKDNLNCSWDLYVYTIGAEENPINLTNNPTSSDEDPKFYPNSSDKIVFKSTAQGMYYIKSMDIATNIIRTIYSSDSMECSMPYYSADGLNIFFSGLVDEEADIYEIPASGGTPVKVIGCSDTGIQEYYPVTKDSSGFFYTRPEPNDMIYFKNTKTNENPVSMPFNALEANNSDACVVDSNYTIISSDRDGGAGCYDLYICDNITGEVWSLDDYNNGVNTAKNELGANYTFKVK